MTEVKPTNGKYSWEGKGYPYVVIHKEGEVKTTICIAASAEIAHFIATACNQYKEPE